MNKKLWVLFLMIGVVLLAACQRGDEGAVPAEGETTTPSAAEAVVEEATATLVPRSGVTILADGHVVAVQPPLPVGFDVSGRILDIQVAAGDEVSRGDVLAILDDANLQEAVTVAELRVSQGENSLAQATAELNRLTTWEPDENAVAVAEANVASAQNNLNSARTQDAAAGNSLTAVNISITQAERELANAQEKYDNAFSPGREWEVAYDQPICDPGEIEPCRGITYAERIKNDREFATIRLQNAQEQLQIAQSNLALERSRTAGRSAVGAEASLTAAEAELTRALTGPTDVELEAARLNVHQAEIVLEQDQLTLQQAREDLSQAQLLAPWAGTILSVDAAPGAFVGGGSPVVTLLDTSRLEFNTTNLSERDLAQIRPGQVALVTLKTYPNDPIEGRVIRIGTQASGTVSDAAVFPVIINLDGSDLDIRPGMTGRVEIRAGE